MSPEAIRIPSAGAVFWAEANPDPTAATAVRAITGRPPRLNVSISSPLPRGISVIAGGRGIVLLTSPIYYDHTPTEAELATPPTVPAVTLAGSVQSLDGRFNPRQFSVTPSPAAPSYVPLRPSLQSLRVTEAGAVVLNVKWQSGAAAASWALLRLTCVRTGVTIVFSGQADFYGDVIIPLTGLPPLPPSLTVDNMTLTALADPTQAGQSIGNPDTTRPVQVSTGGAFAAQQSFNVKRGQISNAAALGISGVTLQP